MLRKIKISTRLAIAFLILASLTALTGFLGFRFVGTVGENGVDIARRLTPWADACMETKVSALEAHLSFEEALGERDRLKLKISEEAIARSAFYVNALLEGAKNEKGTFLKFTDEGLRAKLLETKAACIALREEMVEIFTRKEAGEPTSALEEKFNRDFSGFVGRSDEMETVVQQMMAKGMEKAETEFRDATSRLMTISAVAVLTALALAWFVSVSINAPLSKAVHAAEAISAGDLKDLDKDDYIDEVGILLGSMQKMVANLRAGKLEIEGHMKRQQMVISDVSETADQIFTSSNQVSEASQSLSQNATEQAAGLEEITSSLVEIETQTRGNAENADKANQLAMGARDNAEKGTGHIDQMNTAMKEITESSIEISKIMKAIDEIAFQTNLLALNAAVEAARAGKHGKGFAVVAEEVRNLAARSAKAVGETSKIIDLSSQRSKKGLEATSKTAEAFGDILTSVIKVSDLVGEIAVASREQVGGIKQTAQALAQLDQATQHNASSAEETAAASVEMASQATRLRDILEVFNSSRQ